jgi:hypothetical protein
MTEVGMDQQTHQQHDESAAGLERVLPPETGDADIDTALVELAAVLDDPVERHIEVGERVHQVLQGRLGDLGGT